MIIGYSFGFGVTTVSTNASIYVYLPLFWENRRTAPEKHAFHPETHFISSGGEDLLTDAVIRAQRGPSHSAVCPTAYIIQCGFNYIYYFFFFGCFSG